MLFRWIFKQGPHLALGHTLDMPELQLPAKKMEQIHSNKCLHVQLYFGFYFGTKLFPVCQTLVWFEASLLKPPSGQSGRAGASWSMDSGSDDSHRWSDTLSIDEKDGFVFVNYSEGQTKGPHPHLAPQAQSSGPHSLHSASVEARTYNQLRAGLCPCTLHLLWALHSALQTAALQTTMCVHVCACVRSQATDGSVSWSSAANSPCTQRLTGKTTPTPLRSAPSPSPSMRPTPHTRKRLQIHNSYVCYHKTCLPKLKSRDVLIWSRHRKLDPMKWLEMGPDQNQIPIRVWIFNLFLLWSALIFQAYYSRYIFY